MATHEIAIRENTGATSEGAPFLGQYVVKGNVESEEVIAKVATEAKLTDTVARAIVEGAFDAIAEDEREGLTKFNLGPFTVCAVVTGSFPSSDAAFDAERNRLMLAVRINDETRLCLANVTPTIVTDKTATKVRIDTVTDVDRPKPYSVIYGQNPFKCQGYNLVMTDAGANIRLVNRNRQTFACIVDEAGGKGFVIAHTAELLEPDDYKVVVSSRGGDAEGSLQTAKRNVKYLRVENPAPELEKVYSFQHEDDTEHLYDGNSAIMEGTALSGAAVTVQALDGVWGEETTIPAEQLVVTDTKITVDGQWLADWAVEKDVGYTDSVRFHVTTANGSAMIASIWSDNE